MNQNLTSVRYTLIANRVIVLLLTGLLFVLPRLLRWFGSIRSLTYNEQWVIAVAFYCCAVVTFYALWNMDVLLRNILREQVFTPGNVRSIRHIRWCCAMVSVICAPAAVCYPPLIFMTVIMGFLFLVVNVVCQVMKAAVILREENDLTV